MSEIITPPAINYPYNAIELTMEINRVPNVWGRLQELSVFPTKGLTTTHVEIGYENNRVYLLELGERDRPATHGDSEDQDSKIFKIPGAKHMETIRPADLQDKFEFGSGRRVLAGVDSATSTKLLNGRRHFALTWEHVRSQALQGIIRTPKGRILYNLFEAFDIEQKVINFDLGNSNSKVLDKINELADHIEDNLEGEVMTGIRVMVSRDFFSALTNHSSVEKYFLAHAGATTLADAKLKGTISFERVTFEVYRAFGTNLDGNTVRFVGAGVGYAYPEGTLMAARTFFAPPVHIEHVNTIAPEIFVSTEILKHGAGIELQMQSHPLPLWTQPKVLVKVVSST